MPVRPVLSVLFAFSLSAAAAPPERIAPGHIVQWARSDAPFSAHRGYVVQVLGKSPAARTVAESGIHGALLPSGETLRFGKRPDPANPRRRAMAFQLSPHDPPTSGARRVEIAFAPAIDADEVYWIAFRMYVFDWGHEAVASLFGSQMRSGATRLGLSPVFALHTSGARHFRIETHYSTDRAPSPANSVALRHDEHAIPFGRWTDFVFRFRYRSSAGGFLQAWMDGRMILDYRGPLGFATPGDRAYAKFGLSCASSFEGPRMLLLDNPTIVHDPSGTTYTAELLRAHVQ